jgi:hypothetical protein
VFVVFVSRYVKILEPLGNLGCSSMFLFLPLEGALEI